MEILRLPDKEPFIANANEVTNFPVNQIAKLDDITIFFCHRGTARLEIDLQSYEIVENTQLVILPGSIINYTYVDFLHPFHQDSVRGNYLPPRSLFLSLPERTPLHHRTGRTSQTDRRPDACNGGSIQRQGQQLPSADIQELCTKLPLGFLRQDPASLLTEEARRPEPAGRALQTLHPPDPCPLHNPAGSLFLCRQTVHHSTLPVFYRPECNRHYCQKHHRPPCHPRNQSAAPIDRLEHTGNSKPTAIPGPVILRPVFQKAYRHLSDKLQT